MTDFTNDFESSADRKRSSEFFSQQNYTGSLTVLFSNLDECQFLQESKMFEDSFSAYYICVMK